MVLEIWVADKTLVDPICLIHLSRIIEFSSIDGLSLNIIRENQHIGHITCWSVAPILLRLDFNPSMDK